MKQLIDSGVVEYVKIGSPDIEEVYRGKRVAPLFRTGVIYEPGRGQAGLTRALVHILHTYIGCFEPAKIFFEVEFFAFGLVC